MEGARLSLLWSAIPADEQHGEVAPQRAAPVVLEHPELVLDLVHQLALAALHLLEPAPHFQRPELQLHLLVLQ